MNQREQVKSFLYSWKEGVINIGKVFLEGGDYQNRAEEFLSKHYAFDTEEVLFKPTFTCLLYTSPSPRDYAASRMPSSA